MPWKLHPLGCVVLPHCILPTIFKSIYSFVKSSSRTPNGQTCSIPLSSPSNAKKASKFLCIGARCGDCEVNPITISQSQVPHNESPQIFQSHVLASESNSMSALHKQEQNSNSLNGVGFSHSGTKLF